MPYLRHATESDATLIASFSEMVFNTSFPGLLDMGVSLEILRRFYNAQAISDGIKGEEVFLLLFNDLSEKELTGYVSVEPVNDGLWVLHKLYVSPAHHRRHIGSRLMDDALDYISRHIHNTVCVQLNLNRHNTPALRLYQTKGFHIVREENGMLGEHPKTDFVMATICEPHEKQ